MFRLWSKILLIPFFLLIGLNLINAQCTLIVSHGGNSGIGSLRDAIICANNSPGDDEITFQFTATPPLFIFLIDPLPPITDDGIKIDAEGQQIVIDGINFIGGTPMEIAANNCEVYGLTFQNFFNVNGYHIEIPGDNNIFGGTGTNANTLTGASTISNGLIITGVDNTVRGNTITNFFGTGAGVSLSFGSSNGLVEENTFYQVNNSISVNGSDNNDVLNNSIGIDPSGGLNGGFSGVGFGNNASGNLIQGNTIAGCTIGIRTSPSTGGLQNTFSQNIYTCNGTGIALNGFNEGQEPPNIVSASTTAIIGTADAGEVIEVYSFSQTECPNSDCQGRNYLGNTITDALGNWTFSGTFMAGENITAIATDLSNNTSEFSACTTVSFCAVDIVYNTTDNPTLILTDFVEACPSTTIQLFAQPQSTGTYDYLWTRPNGETVCCDVTGIVASESGIYTLQSTETGSGCVHIDQIEVQYFPQSTVTISTTPKNSFCPSEPINANLVASPGFPSYVWSTGQTGQTITATTAGTYVVTATDGNGCTAVAIEFISQLPPAGVQIWHNINGGSTNTNTSILACEGDAVNLLSIEPGDDPTNPTFTNYNWSTGETTQNITVTEFGIYSLTVTDQSGCTGETSVTVAFNSPFPFINGTDQVCEGDIIQLNETGGTAVQWNWSGPNGFTDNVQTPSIPSVTLANGGTYTVTITDSNGCTNETSFDVTVLEAPTAALPNLDETICEGESASFTVNFSGVAPYTFVYSENSIAQPAITTSDNPFVITVFPTESTLYEPVSIESANSCVGTVSGNAFITVLPIPTANPASLIGCDDGTGAAIFDLTLADNDVNGGSGNAVTWYEDNSGTFPITNPTAYNSSGGIVYATVTSNDCESVPAEVTLSIDNIFLICQEENAVTTPGGSDGEASIDIFGGTAPYSYTWNLEGGGTDNGIFVSDGINLLFGLSAGNYELDITDANNCTANCTFTITEPLCDGFSVALDSIDVSCFGGNDGSIETTVTGGEAPYQFAWNDTNLNGIEDPQDLFANVYTVTVTDANDCTATATTTVNQPDEIVLDFDINNITCFGDNDGSVTVNANGGTGNITFLWSNSSTNTTINSLSQGTYVLTATDENDCEVRDSVFISEPDSLIASISDFNHVNVLGGNTGNATASATGGTISLDYNYLWNNDSTTQMIDSIPVGTYIVTVTDDNGCSDTASVEIIQPDTLMVEIITTDESAFNANDGTATANPSGGTGPYTFDWSNGSSDNPLLGLAPGTYSLTLTDGNGFQIIVSFTIDAFVCPQLDVQLSSNNISCFGANDGWAFIEIDGDNPPFTTQWSNGATTDTIENLGPGNYIVSVTDVTGCQVVDSVQIIEPTLLQVSAFSTNETAFDANDGTASATVTGGTVPYILDWGSGLMGDTLSNLSPGDYTLTVTDANNCVDSVTVNVAAFVCGNLQISTSSANVTCNGLGNGTASAIATGGNAPFTYTWSNGIVNDTIDNLSPGEYIVTATDATNCPIVDTIVISEPAVLMITITEMNISMMGEMDGSATVEIEGGTPPYSISWETGESTETIENLGEGTYGVTVTDANNCSQTGIAVINLQGSDLELSTAQTNVSCSGGSDGTATVNIQVEGIPPYTYLWNTGASTPTIENLEAGNYFVEVTDATNTTQFAAVTITEPNPLSFNFTGIISSCANDANGQVAVIANGGTPPYSYMWNDGQTDSLAIDLAADTYSVTVMDANSCSVEGSVDILELEVPNVSLSGEFTICSGESTNLPIILSGNPPFEVSIFNGTTTTVASSNSSFLFYEVSPTENTTYTITNISDANCSNTDLMAEAIVNVLNAPQVDNITETCIGDSYIVSFEVTGTTDFSVSGNVDEINGNVVTSLPFASGSNYSFTVINNCGSIPVNGTMDCSIICNTDAGNMENTALSFCEGESIVAVHEGDENLEADDLLQFALLNPSGTFPFNILAISNTSSFDWNTLGNYEVVAIAGNNDGNGQVDLGDPCLSVSNAVTVNILELPWAPISLQWQDTLCEGSDLLLITDTYPTGTQYYWTLANGDTIVTDSASLLIPQIGLEEEGFYNVYVGNGGCLSEPFDEAGFVDVIQIGPASDTIELCGTNETLLEAANIDFGVGVWSSFSPGVVIDDALNSSTEISNLRPGVNHFVWTVTSQICNISDTTTVIFNPDIVVNSDSFVLEATSLTIAFDPFQNDFLDGVEEGDTTLRIITQPESGMLEVSQKTFQYTREGDFEGDIYIDYEVCSLNPVCENACDTARVKITVLYDPNLPVVSKGLTPNGDGANDIWKIINIEQNPNNQVIITNRWGDVIFDKKAYRNQPGVAWDGRFRQKLLPQGAYYFIIKTNTEDNSENVTIKGTVYLLR